MEETNLNNQIPPTGMSKNTKLIAIVLVVGLALLVVVGLLFYKPASKQAPKATPTEEKEDFLNKAKYEAEVTIDKNGFTPSTIKVKPDTKIIWTNKDSKPHRVLVTPGSKTTKYFGSESIAAGALYFDRFIDEGTYHYYDGDNPTANGTIVVAK